MLHVVKLERSSTVTRTELTEIEFPAKSSEEARRVVVAQLAEGKDFKERFWITQGERGEVRTVPEIWEGR